MAKITYLLGAGASANTIPAVADMHKRISEILLKLEHYRAYGYIENEKYENHLNIEEYKIKNSALDEIIEDFRWLLNEAKSYHSLDTLAKKFYLTGEDKKYELLKKSLIVYLVLEQFCSIESKKEKGYKFIKNAIDKRYDSFVAALASRPNSKLKLNNDIKILSWNYDMQMELSLQRFTKEKIIKIKKDYQVFPLLYESEENKTNLDEFSIRKLNGNAIFTTEEPEVKGEDCTVFDNSINRELSNEDLLGLLLIELNKFNFQENSACRFFNFSWEGLNDFKGRTHDGYKNNLLEAERIAAQTDILVVIGYSFPIFNREVDNKLFNKMNRLTKVYIQDKYPERIKSTMVNAFKILQENIGGYAHIPLKPRVTFQEETNTDQFVIPYELNQE